MKKLLYTLAIVFPIVVLGQSTNQNYVKSITYKKEIIKIGENLFGLNGEEPKDIDKLQQVTYIDGLGRPMQANTYKAGGVKAPVNELNYDWNHDTFCGGFS